MMKKLFTLWMLMLCAGVGWAADETIFSAMPTKAWDVPASATDTEITSTYATITGGKMYVTNKESDAKAMVKNQGKELAFQHTSNNTFFKVVLNGALQAGDVISVRMQSRTDTDLGLWFSTATSRPKSQPTAAIVLAKQDAQTWMAAPNYTVAEGDGICGKNTFYIYRHTGKSTYFNTFKITRAVSGNAPTITTQPADATYTVGDMPAALTVAATPKTAGKALSYQWYSNTTKSTTGGTAISGATTASYTPSTAAVGTTYYYCVVTEEGNEDKATTAIATVTVNAPACAAPTFTIGSYNYEKEGYTVTAQCATDGATLTYKLGSGAATACTAGTPFFVKGGALVVTAAKEGFANASSESVTINAAPSATSPETMIPFNSTKDAYDKDILHVYKASTLASKDYVAGLDGSGGLKLRTGKNTSITGVTGLEIAVNPGYVINKVELTNAKSNNTTAITVPKCYVDGVQLSSFAGSTLPASNSSATISTGNIEALQNVVFQLGTENSQYRAAIKVYYKALTPTIEAGDFDFEKKAYLVTIDAGTSKVKVSTDGRNFDEKTVPYTTYATTTTTYYAVAGNDTVSKKIVNNSGRKNVAWLMEGGYKTDWKAADDAVYQGIDSVFNVVPCVVSDNTKEYTELFPTLAKADAVVITEMITGKRTFSNGLKALVGQVPMVSLKFYNYNNDRWNWGSPANQNKKLVAVKPVADSLKLFTDLVADSVVLFADKSATNKIDAAQNHIQTSSFSNAPADNVVIAKTNGAASIHGSTQKKYIGIGLSSDDWKHYSANAGTLVKNAVRMMIEGDDVDLKQGEISLTKAQAAAKEAVEAAVYLEGKMSQAAQDELDRLVEELAAADPNDAKALDAAARRLKNAVEAAKQSIEAYAEAAEALEVMAAVADTTNFFDAAAGAAYLELLEKSAQGYDEGTLTDDEARKLDKDLAETKKVLLSAWQQDNALSVNTEGNVPFVEAAIDTTAQQFVAQIGGKPLGEYTVKAVVTLVAPAAARGAAAAEKPAVTISLADGKKDTLSLGENVKLLTGKVHKDSLLTLNISVPAKSGIEKVQVKSLLLSDEVGEADLMDLLAISPAEDSVLDSLKQFTITFGGREVDVNIGSVPTLDEQNGSFVLADDAKSVSVNFAEAVYTPGEHVLNIPVNAIYYKGVAIEPLQFHYNVAAVDLAALLKVTPAPGVVDTLKTVTLSFGTQTVALNDTVKTADNLTVSLSDDATSVVVSLAEAYTEPGEYEVEIPEGLIYYLGNVLPDTTLLYTIKEPAPSGSGEVTYALKVGETHTSGDAVSVKSEGGEEVAVLTFGFDGGADFTAAVKDTHIEGMEAYTAGNGVNGTATSGTAYIIQPKYNGEISVGVVLNADKSFFILEDETALADYNGIRVSEKYYGTYTFNVKAGSTYKVYCTGSKLGFYGFDYKWSADADVELTWTPEQTLDFTTATYSENPTLVLSSEKCGTAYDKGNKKQQDIFIATAPAELGGKLAFQTVSNGSGKGWWLRASEGGLYSFGAGRSAAVVDVKQGYRVVFNCTQDATKVMSLINANGDPDGPFVYELSEDGMSYICTLLEDGNVGFFGNSGVGYISSIEILKPDFEPVLTNFTVQYVDGQNEQLKESATRPSLAGLTPTVKDADKANISKDGKDYVYESDNAKTLKVKKDGSTVVSVVFHTVGELAWTVNEVAAGKIVRTQTGSAVEGSTVKVPYRQYNVVDGKLYKKGQTSKEFNYSFKLSRDNQEENLQYDATEVENVVFLSEGEDIEGLTPCTSNNTTIRSSNSASAYAADENVTITKLPAGTYKLTAVIFDASKNPDSYWKFYAGDEVIDELHCTVVNIQELTTAEFTVAADDTPILLGQGGNGNMGLDLVYIVKTGNVQDGINSISTERAAGETIYNLQGQKVDGTRKGLYIINGRKVVMK